MMTEEVAHNTHNKLCAYYTCTLVQLVSASTAEKGSGATGPKVFQKVQRSIDTVTKAWLRLVSKLSAVSAG